MKKSFGFFIALILFLSVCILLITIVSKQESELLICSEYRGTTEHINRVCLGKYGWGSEINLNAHAQMALNTFYLDN